MNPIITIPYTCQLQLIMPQSLSNTLIHIVFSTKHRAHFIDDDIESKLFGYIGQICNAQKCRVIIIGGYRNHVHIFCSLYRPLSQSKLVQEIKANSSKWMKTQGSKYENFYWQDGYAVFSVSQVNSTRLIDYIRNQKQHHQRKIFEAEYKELLERSAIEYDEKYMWD